ncbi:MAG: sigma-70 family RNA polymerase sigma factor [Nitrospirae bacterium]|nr:sigma-70 family RNA polymerase sigma factor [Nitrospirota bacterium]
MPEDPDRAWVRGAQAGDAESFTPLILRHQKRIYNLALRMLGDAAEAEDLTQEVFVAAYEQIRQFREEAAFPTWLHQIAVRRGLNRLRDLNRRPLKRALSLDDPPQDGGRPLEVADPAPSPETLHERREMAAILQEGLGRLPEEARMIVILREVQGLAYEEIAAILRMELGTVKSRLHRARLALADYCRSAMHGGRHVVR